MSEGFFEKKEGIVLLQLNKCALVFENCLNLYLLDQAWPLLSLTNLFAVPFSFNTGMLQELNEKKQDEKKAEIEKRMSALFTKLDALFHYNTNPPEVVS